MNFEMGTMVFQMMMMAIAGLLPLLLALVVLWLAWRWVKAQELIARSLARIADSGADAAKKGVGDTPLGQQEPGDEK
ncbi:hypothetical protein [Desmospora profundinema]|uniref:Cytochrome bd-type quinol oxidase subunit 1 n=1 Tax=Desmospora profundinema TaxID=1571184 RepID=A0ABU1IRU0_9BACL|nr:hypothetical protein [Desmospora profundinema]MDR6227272.1 cytochrome bd-type quinol oxidase subunit 1 [Desmospora profundinema]